MDWLTADLLVIGTELGAIVILKNSEVSQCIPYEESKPNEISSMLSTNVSSRSIEVILVNSRGFIAGSRNSRIAVFETVPEYDDVDDGILYKMKQIFPVPEELTISNLRTMALTSTEGTLLVELESNQIFKTPMLYGSDRVG